MLGINLLAEEAGALAADLPADICYYAPVRCVIARIELLVGGAETESPVTRAL